MKKTLTQMIAEMPGSFNVDPNKFIQLRPLKMFRLGFIPLTYAGAGTIQDFSEYVIDEDGDLYSINNDTYVTDFGIRLTQL